MAATANSTSMSRRAIAALLGFSAVPAFAQEPNLQPLKQSVQRRFAKELADVDRAFAEMSRIEAELPHIADENPFGFSDDQVETVAHNKALFRLSREASLDFHDARHRLAHAVFKAVGLA